MAVTSHVYTMLTKSLVDKVADLDSDALKCMLFSSYTPAQDTHQFMTAIKAAGTEASGTGYSAGGMALTTVTLTKSGHVYTLDCDDVVWTTSTISASHAVFYDSTPGADATNPGICYWDLGGTQTSSAASFTLTINASGLVTFTAS